MKLNILCSDCHFDSVSDGGEIFQIFRGICHKYYFSVTRGPCCSRRCSRTPHCSLLTDKCSGMPLPSGLPQPTPPSSSRAGWSRTRRRRSSAWSTSCSATLSSTSAYSLGCSTGRTGPGGGAPSSTEGRTPGLKYVRIRIWLVVRIQYGRI